MKTTAHLLHIDTIEAPAGAPFAAVHLVADGDYLCAVDFAGFEARMQRLLARRYRQYELVEKADPGGASTCLSAYLDGDIGALDRLPVRTGGTEFQSAAWLALRAIPAGTTATYREQATRIGRPAAVRAIGAANGQNPLAIVLPCHRVVGMDGSLTGYAGGLDTKRWLLRHEARHAGALSGATPLPSNGALFA
jgi:methylated-DNA-[protein]-cysteine S-methyltransferase